MEAPFKSAAVYFIMSDNKDNRCPTCNRSCNCSGEVSAPATPQAKPSEEGIKCPYSWCKNGPFFGGYAPASKHIKKKHSEEPDFEAMLSTVPYDTCDFCGKSGLTSIWDHKRRCGKKQPMEAQTRAQPQPKPKPLDGSDDAFYEAFKDRLKLRKKADKTANEYAWKVKTMVTDEKNKDPTFSPWSWVNINPDSRLALGAAENYIDPNRSEEWKKILKAAHSSLAEWIKESAEGEEEAVMVAAAESVE